MNKELDKFLNRNIDDVLEIQRIIEEMLDEMDKYGYAEDTLRGIYDMVEETGAVTEGQRTAVENIRRKPSTKYGRRRRW